MENTFSMSVLTLLSLNGPEAGDSLGSSHSPRTPATGGGLVWQVEGSRVDPCIFHWGETDMTERGLSIDWRSRIPLLLCADQTDPGRSMLWFRRQLPRVWNCIVRENGGAAASISGFRRDIKAIC